MKEGRHSLDRTARLLFVGGSRKRTRTEQQPSWFRLAGPDTIVLRCCINLQEASIGSRRHRRMPLGMRIRASHRLPRSPAGSDFGFGRTYWATPKG